MDSMKGSVMDMINDLAAQMKQNGKVVTPEPAKTASTASVAGIPAGWQLQEMMAQ